MRKKLRVALLLCLGLASLARADVLQGTTIAAELSDITAEADGTLIDFPLRLGQRIEAGELLGSVKKTGVFAPMDGRVTRVFSLAGETVSGELMTIEPTSPYDVYCSVEHAYRTIETATVHIGETVYIRCAADGSHRAVGRVVSLDGLTYHVEILGGDLFQGEAVFVYREADWKDEHRIGTGTVLPSSVTTLRAEGVLLDVCTQEGDEVEKGQLLARLASSSHTEVRSPAAGIVCEILRGQGSTVEEGQTLARVASQVLLTSEADATRRADYRVGTRLRNWRADDAHTLSSCRVTRVLASVGDASVTLELTPESGGALPIGMTVYIMDEVE